MITDRCVIIIPMTWNEVADHWMTLIKNLQNKGYNFDYLMNEATLFSNNKACYVTKISFARDPGKTEIEFNQITGHLVDSLTRLIQRPVTYYTHDIDLHNW